MNRVLQFLRDHRAALVPEPDGDLLARFAASRDEAAFAQLVARHGGVVAGVCRRMLANPADRDDAFQAVFVVLARKAGSLNGSRPLAPWLHKVAVWTAKSVRRANARRARWQEPLTVDRAGHQPPDGLAADLDEALLSLPERYRVPVVMCYLEGWTRAELSAHLGCPEGTLSARLSRGLAKLRARLGDAAPALLLTLGVAGVPSATAHATAATVAAGGLTASVLTLSHEVLRMFWLPKLLTLTAGSAATVAATGAAVVALAGPPGPGLPGTPVTAPIARVQPAAPPAKVEDKKPEPPKPAEAEKPAFEFPELAEYERLSKLQAELAAEERRGQVRLAKSQAAQVLAARKLVDRTRQDRDALAKRNENFAVARPSGGKVDYPVILVWTYSPPPPGEEKPAEPKGGKAPKGSNPLNPFALSGTAAITVSYLEHNYGSSELPYGDRQELTAGLVKGKAKWFAVLQDHDFDAEQKDDLFAACKAAGVTEFYCPLPLESTDRSDRGHFATPDIIDKLAVKPLGQLPHPTLIRLDLSRLDGKPAAAKEPADAPKIDPDYTEYERLTKLVGELQAELGKVDDRLRRVGALRERLRTSLARRQNLDLTLLYGDSVCVMERQTQDPGNPNAPRTVSVPVARIRKLGQPMLGGVPLGAGAPGGRAIVEETIPYYDRADLAAELKRNGVERLVVSHKQKVGVDEVTEILAAAKAARVRAVYLPKPLPTNTVDAETRALIAKFGVTPAADATPSLFVQLDLSGYTPPAAAKP